MSIHQIRYRIPTQNGESEELTYEEVVAHFILLLRDMRDNDSELFNELLTFCSTPWGEKPKPIAKRYWVTLCYSYYLFVVNPLHPTRITFTHWVIPQVVNQVAAEAGQTTPEES